MAKLTDQSALTTPASGDFLHVVDVSDTTDDAAGSSKKVELQHIPSAIGAQIKVSYEAEEDTNAYTDAEKTKLAGIEEGAEVNVSETDPVVGAVTGLVKADGSGNISAAVADTDYQSVPSEGAFEDGDKTKLDGIGTGADVVLIASGSQALGTSEIADGACASVITVAATGVATTDVITICYNSTPVGKTGYDPTDGSELIIRAYPTTDNVNILVCNNTGAAVTPDAMTINYRVVR